MKIVSICWCFIGCLLIGPPIGYGAPHPDPLQRMAAAISRAGDITDPGEVAQILHDTIGADLMRATDYFGRSDMAAGQTRFSLDERAPLSKRGLEVALLVMHDNGKNPLASKAVLGSIKAELDINDWGVISPRSWRQVAGDLGKLYASVVVPETPGLPSFELPAAPCCRLIMTVAPHKSEAEPVWFVHITQYEIRTKS